MWVWKRKQAYLQQVVCWSSLFGVDLQGQMQKVPENRRQVVLVFDLRGACCGDQIQSSKRRFVQIRRLSLDHFNGHDTQTPDINLSSVLLPADNFRSHPVRCSNHGIPLVLGVIDLGTETKVGWGILLVSCYDGCPFLDVDKRGRVGETYSVWYCHP